MLLRETMTAQGNRLFRKRGFYASILGTPVLLLAFHQYWHSGGDHILGGLGEAACFAVSLAGLAVRAYTVGCRARRTSGRNGQKGQVADALNTTGMYSVTRNPLYLANFLVALGIIMMFSIWWLTVIYIMAFWLHYERIILAEEDFLMNKFGETYLAWAGITPVFIPSVKNWQPPENAFSWRIALKSEYQTLTMTVTAFAFLQIVSHVRPHYTFAAVRSWVYLLMMTMAFFMAVRFIRKKTTFLSVPGR